MLEWWAVQVSGECMFHLQVTLQCLSLLVHARIKTSVTKTYMI
jgi:hypothetical protein